MAQKIDTCSRVNSAISASKLFVSSKRREAILSAVLNPINVELVKQVADAIDEPTVDISTLKEDTENVSDEEDDLLDENELNETFGVHDLGDSSLVTEDMLDDYSLDDVEDSDSELEDEPAEDTEDIEEDTQVSGASVTACTNVDTESLKGSLNGVADTAGVSRIFMKGDECWIYYNDDINLNTVMSSVIEYINASGMTYLEFNRLARSDNAIVFIKHEEAQPIEPIIDVQK